MAEFGLWGREGNKGQRIGSRRMQDNGIAAGKFASVSIYVAYCFNYLNYINLIVSALK